MSVGAGLVVCAVLTRGGSLAAWDETGVLGREWALYAELGRRGVRVVVASYGSEAEERAIAARLPGEPIVVCGEGAALIERAASAAKGAGLRGGGGAIVVRSNQLQGSREALEIARAVRAGGGRAVLAARGGYDYSRGFAARFGPTSEPARDAAAEEALVLPRADRVIVTTERIAELLAWRHALPMDRFEVVPNYVTDDRPPVTDPSGREGDVVLAVGRLDPLKRFDLLIGAVGRLGGGARLEIVGSGPEENALRRAAERSGAPVVFVGRLSHAEVLGRVRRCAVFAQASSWEGHPKTVLEAMHAGAAVVCATAPGLSETVRPEETGVLSAARAESLARAIGRLLDNAPLRERLGSAAASWTRRRLAVGVIADRELEIYADALGERSTDGASCV